MTPTTPASASVQSEQTRRPWAVFDSQGFYKLERSEVEARAFCDTYNARNPNDPLRPYTCCAMDDVRHPQQPSATGGDGETQRFLEVQPGVVNVYVVAGTGSGKSGVAGEIEIAMKALGLDVEWIDGQPEKNSTGADWQDALEMYKPRVVIREINVVNGVSHGL
jgi:hypothetical protein